MKCKTFPTKNQPEGSPPRFPCEKHVPILSSTKPLFCKIISDFMFRPIMIIVAQARECRVILLSKYSKCDNVCWPGTHILLLHSFKILL